MSATDPDPSLTAAEWAWCAGLFEGEGCIMFTNLTSVRLDVAMTDRDVIERLDALWPSPNGIYMRKVRHGDKACWRWQISARERVEGFLVGIYPWLGERRRARATAALERLTANHGQRGLRTRCLRGHPLSEDNLIYTKAGKRQCRTCKNTAARAFYHRRRAAA